MRACVCLELEKALHLWVIDKGNQQGVLTHAVLIDKTQQLGKLAELKVPAKFQYSQGWLEGFMRRQAIHTIQLNGEAGSADMAGVTFARETLGPLLAHLEQADGSHITTRWTTS